MARGPGGGGLAEALGGDGLQGGACMRRDLGEPPLLACAVLHFVNRRQQMLSSGLEATASDAPVMPYGQCGSAILVVYK